MKQSDLNMVAGKRVYVTPNIPPDKLSNALKSYARCLTPDEVLILIDDTLWGGSREGMIVTENMLFCKELGDSPRQYHMAKLQRIHYHNKSVYINSTKFYTHCFSEDSEVEDVVEFIGKMTTEDQTEAKSGNSAKNTPIYAPGSQEDKIMCSLPQNGENLIARYQRSLFPGQKAQSIMNFAGDIWDKMFSVSVEQENKAYRRDVFHENASNKNKTIATYKFLQIALCFPDYTILV